MTMVFMRLLPVLISFVLLAAHFSRGDNQPLMLLSLLFPLLLLVRKPWVVTAVQVALVVGGLEWLRRTLELVQQRQAAGDPWTRLVVILGVVALFTMASALVFRWAALQERYGRSSGP
ncbi:MAG: hypothetical protein JSW51_02530 [Gemmatimonadota bacterium]|nr:MAG: hypothetical protein JSW51_02530 [Gemmatimonadota bacterium]